MKKYVDLDSVFHVIGHNGSVFIKLTLKTLLFLLVLYVLFIGLDTYIVREYLDWLFGLLGLIFFVKYVIDFFNIYLDALILSPQGITMFMWEGLFDHKTDFFEWDKIETVSHAQNSFWDKLFSRGDLVITLDHGIEYPFENTNAPKKQAEKILKYKEQFSLLSSDDTKTITDDKMAIIAEALSEVVKEYMEKKTTEEEEDDY